jgi:hypothetical protein
MRSKSKDKLALKAVSVKVVQIEWLADNLPDFFYYLAEIEDSAVFNNQLITMLL